MESNAKNGRLLSRRHPHHTSWAFLGKQKIQKRTAWKQPHLPFTTAPAFHNAFDMLYLALGALKPRAEGAKIRGGQ